MPTLAFTWQASPRRQVTFYASSPIELLVNGMEALAGILPDKDHWSVPGLSFGLYVCPPAGRLWYQSNLALASGIPPDVQRAADWLDEHAGELWERAQGWVRNNR